jgi:acetyl/propionyl-CoA carboxylase alpha subunit
MPGIRIDSGVEEASEIPVQYDSMIAKIIATATTRDEAIARLTCALRDFPILGVQTNVPFLIRILEHPRFRAGDVDTGFLDSEGASLAAGNTEMPEVVREAIASYDSSVSGYQSSVESRDSSLEPRRDPWDALTSWRS